MYDQSPIHFDPSPKVSFLPHLVALAKQHDIRLHFHRVKRRPLADGTRPDPPAFRDYLNTLQSWLHDHHCAYSDESPDHELTLDWYRDGDHIADSHRERFCGKFWGLVKDQIGPPPPLGGRDAVSCSLPPSAPQ